MGDEINPKAGELSAGPKHQEIDFPEKLALKMVEMQLSIQALTLSIEEQKIAEKKTATESEPKSKMLGQPLIVAIITGILGLLGAAVANILQGRSTLELETRKFDFASQQEKQKNEATQNLEKQKFETALVLKAIETGNPTAAANNLQFLIDAGYLKDPGGQISKYLKDPKEGRIPVLPRPNSSILGKDNGEIIFETQSPTGTKVRVKKKENDMVEFVDNWEKDNLASVHIPQLIGIKGFPASGIIWFNKSAAEALKSAWKEIADLGLLDRVVSWDGSWSPKMIRGTTGKLSAHAWGLAFDINSLQNTIGKPPPLTAEPGSVRELVPIFEKHGFIWGGSGPRPEGNHFEFRIPEKKP